MSREQPGRAPFGFSLPHFPLRSCPRSPAARRSRVPPPAPSALGFILAKNWVATGPGLWGPEQPRANESDTVVVVAVLSQTLGKHGLLAIAKNIRTCWPSASIPILGDVALDLEAALYGAVIDHRSRLEALLVRTGEKYTSESLHYGTAVVAGLLSSGSTVSSPRVPIRS
jgi:hypothetical protein